MQHSNPEIPLMGQKIERIRRLKGIKQDVLAADLGISRQSLSKLEQSEFIDDEKLEQIAKALGVSSEAIREFDEKSINNINSFFDNSAFNFQCTINPVEKWIEAIDENKRLYEELLRSEKEKNELLKSILVNKK